MGRGRRSRNNAPTASSSSASHLVVNSSTTQFFEDQYCASPKRKDCKIDDAACSLKAALQIMNNGESSLSILVPTMTNHKGLQQSVVTGAKTRSQVAKQLCKAEVNQKSSLIFAKQKKSKADKTFPDCALTINKQRIILTGEAYEDADTIEAELDVRSSSTPIDLTEDTCDGIYDYLKINNEETENDASSSLSTSTNEISSSQLNNLISSDLSTNIFLQEPVLCLDVDKSPNQPSSIKINKTIKVDPVFSTNSYHLTLNGQFNKIVTLSNSSSPPHSNNHQHSETDSTSSTTSSCILINNDSNSCDSGVVIDKQLEFSSPNRRRKPTTPHRILCPSPVKHAIVESSSTYFSTTTSYVGLRDIHPENNIAAVNGSIQPSTTIPNSVHGTAYGKKNLKIKRRLNPTNSENSSMTSPQIQSDVILSQQTQKINGLNTGISQKLALNSTINQTAEQIAKSTFKKHQIRNNGFHSQSSHQTKDKNVHQNTQSKLQSRNFTSSHPTKISDFFPVRRSVRKTKKEVQEEIMRNIEKAIIEGRDDGLKVVEEFEGKGRGVVAERLFKRGEFVVEYIGDLINMSEANQREKKYSLDENTGCYMYYFKHCNQQYCIDATAESGKLGRLVNHSRNGNLITKVVVVKNHPHLVLIAKDDIHPGDELTYDYGDRSKEALLHHPWLAL